MSHNFRVLLVDDDPNVQTMFQMVLDHYGVTVDIAGDEASASAFLEQYQHNQIVLGIFWPAQTATKCCKPFANFRGIIPLLPLPLRLITPVIRWMMCCAPDSTGMC
jgi:DNA-binding response OmpR family regulator